MKTIQARIEQLEAARLVDTNPFMGMPLSELMAKIEAGAGLPAGSLPRTTDQAVTMGFESIAGATAAALGMTLQEFKAELQR